MENFVWKGNILWWSWEFCKRPTGCRGCHKTMKKGEHRLKTVQPVAAYYFKQVKYYCQECGDKIVNGIDDSRIFFNKNSVTEIEKRKRFIRPERREEQDG